MATHTKSINKINQHLANPDGLIPKIVQATILDGSKQVEFSKKTSASSYFSNITDMMPQRSWLGRQNEMTALGLIFTGMFYMTPFKRYSQKKIFSPFVIIGIRVCLFYC